MLPNRREREHVWLGVHYTGALYHLTERHPSVKVHNPFSEPRKALFPDVGTRAVCSLADFDPTRASILASREGGGP